MSGAVGAGGPSIVWSEAALRLFELTGPTVVSAGAGSGKTTCLVELCIRLLSGEATGTPNDPSDLVAITFTEKAAAELEERLREAVAERARLASGRGPGGNAGREPDPAAGPGLDDERAWRRLLHRLDRMAIGTIHGFAGRLLREHALEAGLDPDFEVLDEEASEAWRRDAAGAAVLAALDAGRPGTLALAAGYGAGGRSGLAQVVAEIARERSTHGETAPILPCPEAPGAAQASRAEALGAARALLAERACIETPTGREALARLAGGVAAIEAADLSGPLEPAALKRVAALAEALRGWRPGASAGGAARKLKEDIARACQEFEAKAAEILAGPQKRELCALVAEAEVRYAERKRGERVLDFDDLLARARDLLRRDAGLLAELRGRLRALLVDEYQDVNGLQQEIFELLSGGPAPRPVLVAVGDLKQSIYRFRGADVAVFRGLIERLAAGAPEPREAPDRSPARQGPPRALVLPQNHRSCPAVLELVNEVSGRCMRPGGADLRPYELAFGDSDRLVPMRTGGQWPGCELLVDEGGGDAAERRSREARAIAERIQAVVGGAAGALVFERAGGVGREERGRRPRHRDVALLFRRMTQIGVYERALREAGIPYRLARGGGFYQAPEVRDLGELLATLVEPQDALAWAALLRSPMCGLGEGALFAVSRLGLETLAMRQPDEVVRELVQTYPAAALPWAGWPASAEADRLRRFLSEWHGLRAVRDRLALPDLLGRAVDRLDLEAAHLASPDGERRLANLRKALAMAEAFGRRGGTAAGLADRLRAMAARPPREPEAELETGDAVALLSIHQAKGLEWPVVFVPDLGAASPRDGRRALRDSGGSLAAAFFDAASGDYHVTAALGAAREEARRAAAAESRRLLYVALTRARDRLILSGEAGRGAESWRGFVEAALAARPELAARIPLAEAATFSVGEPRAASEDLPPPPAGTRSPSAPARGMGEVVEGRPAPVSPADGPLTVPSESRVAAVRLAVTELAEHARCPRRLFLARHLGLAERGGGHSQVQDDPERATARGTLAHAMLSELELGAPPLERRAQLAAAAARRGHDPGAPGVRRIMSDVTRFLDSVPGRELARASRAGALRREVPFLLRLDGDGTPACYLVGAVDAVVEARGSVAVLDFKYALPRRGTAERYRLQLLAYALAASRAMPGRKVTAGVQFLRGACASVDLTPSGDDLRRFAREAPRLAAEAYAGAGLSRTPAQLGRDEGRCRAEGCGFVARCYVAPR